MKFIDEIKFNPEGLIPVIIQDSKNNDVLMLGYMNKDTVQMTLESGKVHFWSRSRRKIWIKGETSGHTQKVIDLFFDCDMDTILIKVEQEVAACHTGYRSCFFKKIDGDRLVICGEKIFDEKEVYKNSTS